MPSNHTNGAGEGKPEVVTLERDLTSALDLAVACERVVWRGAAASPYADGAQAFLCGLVSSDTISFPCHYSATVSEDMAREFLCLDDDEKCISVLLRIEARTARYLRPFRHHALDEDEVVLLEGVRYRCTERKRNRDPNEGHEYWELSLEELV